MSADSVYPKFLVMNLAESDSKEGGEEEVKEKVPDTRFVQGKLILSFAVCTFAVRSIPAKTTAASFSKLLDRR